MTQVGNLGLGVIFPCWMISRMNGAYFTSSSPFSESGKKLEPAYSVLQGKSFGFYFNVSATNSVDV
jgi:hypothetical protein